MMKLRGTILPLLFPAVVFFLFSPVSGASSSLQEEVNFYFVKMDEAFARIVESGAVKSTSLRSAERFFIREMRKNLAYNTFIRTNSKGLVISEVIRGQKVERPMRDISNQKWFRMVSQKKEAYYSLIRDQEKGRYYLFWARPILKRGNRFIGSVLLKIDLWDSFHEFSSSIFTPFLIKLGRKSLFSNKWEEGATGIEKPLTVQGIDRISIVYSSERAPATAVEPKETSTKAVTVADTEKEKKADKPAKEKRGASGILVVLLVILILGIAGASFMLIAWMRRRAFLKHLDEEETI
ncbi:MAG: cache domain-containing protein [Chitinispirillaceae bacterium]|nr:cache domain-containing protein [Chitinispirillaceae bacterium]